MKIIDRYLLIELVGPFFAVMAITTLLNLSYPLYDLIELKMIKNIPFPVFFQILFYKLPAIAVLSFPVSILGSTLLSLGRLVKDSELIAIRMSHLSFYRLMIPFLFVGVIVSLWAYWINESVVPWTNHRSENLFRQVQLSQNMLDIQENRFFEGGDNRFFFVRKVYRSQNRLEGVVIYEATTDPYPRLLSAREAVLSGNAWKLRDGFIHKLSPQGAVESEIKFDELAIKIRTDMTSFFTEQRTPQEMSRQELQKQISLLRQSRVSTKALETDYHFKVSFPFACFIFVLIGAPLSLFSMRGGSFIGILLVIVLGFMYYDGLMPLSRAFGLKGYLPPFWAAWIPNLFFVLVGSFLVWKVEH